MPRHADRFLAPRILALLAAFGAVAALGVAFGSEAWGGLVPCALCLLERWPYRFAIVCGVAAAMAPAPLVRPLLFALVMSLVADAAVGFVHVGVEQAWWPSPLPECAAVHVSGRSIAERLASMPARPSKPCDEPTFFVPGIPLSMAEANLLFAIGLSAGLLGFLPPVHRSRF